MGSVAILCVLAVAALLSASVPAATARPHHARAPHHSVTDADATDVPQQVHISQGDSMGTSMIVSWITNSTQSGMVMYKTATSSSSTVGLMEPAFQYSFVNAYTGSYTSGWIHHANITGLTPATTYFYSCGVTGAMSQQFSFTTPPAVGPEAHVVFGLIGDLGQTVNSSTTMEHVMADPTIQFSLLMGDLSYADSADNPNSRGVPCTQTRWDSWGVMVEPWIANQPLMVLPGNHEIELGPTPGTQTSFLAFLSRFRMPAPSSGATNGNLYYSFNTGSAHVIMLNSYMDYSKGSPQYDWVVNDLEKVDRSVTPWLFVGVHAPWYNSNMAHHNEPQEYEMREALESSFKKYGVDIVFAGHVHAYERTYPVYDNHTTSDGVTYINIGDGGNREGPATTYYPQPSWSAYRQGRFGHGRLELFNSTHAHWQWQQNDYPSTTISDDVWLIHKSNGFGLEHVFVGH